MNRIFVLFLLTFLPFLAKAGNDLTGLKNYRPVHYFAQSEEDKERFLDRVTFGGNIGLQFGNYTNVLISPAIGYIPRSKFLNDRLMVGIGITYMYLKISTPVTYYEANIYGGRTFARFVVYKNIFTYLEHEFLNAPVYNYYLKQREWVNSVFLGGGYLLQLTQKGGVMISVLYNVAWTPLHPLYSNPWNIRVGFML